MTDFDAYHRSYRMMLALFGLWLGAIALVQFVIHPLFILGFYGTEGFMGLWDKKIPDFTLSQQRLLVVISNSIIFLLPPFVLGRIFRESSTTILGSFKRPPSTLLVLGFAAIILCIPFIYTSNEVNHNLPLPDELWQMEQSIEETQQKLFEQPGWWAILGNFFIIAVMAPLTEEVFFRGALQRIILRITANEHVAIILASIAFSAIHMEFAGFLPRFILGMILGYMAFWSGNLWVPIFCHAVFNGSQLALVYLLRQDVIESAPEQVSVPIYLGIFSVITTALVLKQFYTRTIIKQDIPE